jgi:hypothetical protein
MCCDILRIWQVCGSLQAVMPVSEACGELDVCMYWYLCFDCLDHNPVNSTIKYRKPLSCRFICNEKPYSLDKCVFI